MLLLINGIGALYGGGSLVLYPDGSGLKLPLSVLQFSPFSDFLIPGIILFSVNGVLSLIVFVCLIVEARHYAWFIIAQGSILFGWILTQVLMIQGIGTLHYIFGSIGLLLMLLGLLLVKIMGVTKSTSIQ